MMHHHIKLGNNMFGDSEDIRYHLDKQSLHFNLDHDLDLKRSNPIFSQDTLAYDDNQVWQPAVQKIYQKESYFDQMSPNCDLDLEDSKQFFVHDTSTHDAAPSHLV